MTIPFRTDEIFAENIIPGKVCDPSRNFIFGTFSVFKPEEVLERDRPPKEFLSLATPKHRFPSDPSISPLFLLPCPPQSSACLKSPLLYYSDHIVTYLSFPYFDQSSRTINHLLHIIIFAFAKSSPPNPPNNLSIIHPYTQAYNSLKMRSVRSCLRSVALSVPLLAPVFALPAPLQHRDTAQSDSCVSSRSSDASCAFLLSTCASIQTLATTTANPWGNFSCVAAAICSSPGAVLDTLACASATLSASSTNSAVARVGHSASMPNLDYAVYASIVGPCAYKSGGCPITSQNVIDYIYSLLKNSKAPVWPSSADHVAKSFWNPVTEWAGVSRGLIS